MEVQETAKAPEALSTLRCPRDSLPVACMYAFVGLGGPWWCWETRCTLLLKGDVTRRNRSERRQIGCEHLLLVKHHSPLFITAYVALYVSEKSSSVEERSYCT